MVLICQWILASMQSSEETSHSRVRWEDHKRYLIYQVHPRKAYVKAMEELDSLSSWEAHCKVSGRSFPQDVWNRWFNHLKFLVLPTWLNTCPLFLQQQQVPFTILGNNTCTTHYCSQGSAQVSCHRAPFRCHSPANTTNSRTTVFTFPRHTELVLPSLAIPVPQLEYNPTLGAQDKHSTLQGHLSDRHVLLWWTIHSSRGILLTGRSDHPLQGLLQNPAISVKREYNRFIKLCYKTDGVCVTHAVNNAQRNLSHFPEDFRPPTAVTQVSLCHICQTTVKNTSCLTSQIQFIITRMLGIPIKRQVDTHTKEQPSQTQGSYY